jgi:shikimate kinase/3-dehydroquinate synthase
MSGIGHVVLVGLPGCGKTTIGPLLAHHLDRRSLDTDSEVEDRLGRSIETVFADLGEERFRAEELSALTNALESEQPLVVSAGGGLIAQPGVAATVARRATIVWLDAPDAELVRRLGSAAARRPLLADGPADRLHTLRSQRASAHAHAQIHVDSSQAGPEETAAELAKLLKASVRVATEPPYLVTVAGGAVDGLARHLPESSRRVVVVCDTSVAAVGRRVAAHARDTGRTVTEVAVEGGEQFKHWSTAGMLVERCSEAGLDRDDCIVAIGGGTVGDVAGFAAASYLRGIAWVGVPTTLLAMVDSSIGGKTGVNLRTGKNLAGAFWQPRAVVCDPEVLATLPDRSFRSAFAEIVKSSMVGGGELTTLLEERLRHCLARDDDAVAAVVRACCTLKADVVAGDERETGRRAILNYGHTVGHAVEALTGFGNGPDHGEAVAFGMRVAGRLSVGNTGCPPADIAWQDAVLDECGLTGAPSLDAGAVAARLGADKKARRGVPRWVLLRARGRPVSGIVLEERSVTQALTEALRTA